MMTYKCVAVYVTTITDGPFDWPHQGLTFIKPLELNYEPQAGKLLNLSEELYVPTEGWLITEVIKETIHHPKSGLFIIQFEPDTTEYSQTYVANLLDYCYQLNQVTE